MVATQQPEPSPSGGLRSVELLLCVCLNSNDVFADDGSDASPEERAADLYGPNSYARVFGSEHAARFDALPGRFEPQFRHWLAQLDALPWGECQGLKPGLLEVLSWYADARHWALAHPPSGGGRTNFLISPWRLPLFLNLVIAAVSAWDPRISVGIRKAYSGGRWLASGDSNYALDLHVVLRLELPDGSRELDRGMFAELGFAGCAILCQDAVCFRVGDGTSTSYRTLLFSGSDGEEQAADLRIIREASRSIDQGSTLPPPFALGEARAILQSRGARWNSFVSSTEPGLEEQLLCFSVPVPIGNRTDLWTGFAEELFLDVHAALGPMRLYGITTFECSEAPLVPGEPSFRQLVLLRAPLPPAEGSWESLLPYAAAALSRGLASTLERRLEANRSADARICLARWTLVPPPAPGLITCPDVGTSLHVQMAKLKLASTRMERKGGVRVWEVGLTGNCHCALCRSFPASEGCQPEEAHRGLAKRLAVTKLARRHQACVRVDCRCGCKDQMPGFLCGSYYLPLGFAT